MSPAGTARIPAHEIPTTGAVGWQDRAACRGAESSVFFSPDTERGHARDRREARARQICQDCPVLAQCRDHALAAGEPYGIWGGMTENERRRHARRHRRGEHRSLHAEPSGSAASSPRMPTPTGRHTLPAARDAP